MSSPTFKGKAPETFELLMFLIMSCNKVICLDGDLSDRGYSFMNYFNDLFDVYHMVITVNFNNKTLNIMNDEDDFTNKIINDLNDDLRLVIPTMSSTFGVNLQANLQELFPNKTIMLYNSDSFFMVCWTVGHSKTDIEWVGSNVWHNNISLK